MKGRGDTWTNMAIVAAFAAVLGINVFRGQPDRACDQARGRMGSAYGRVYEQAGPEDENRDPVGKADAYPDTTEAIQAVEGPRESPARPGGEDAEILPDMAESQKTVLDEVMEASEAQDLESAARVMDRGEKELPTLFYEAIDGTRYLYDSQSSSLPMEDKGLVLTVPKILCYDAPEADRPERNCTALWVVELDAPGCDHSQGLWKDEEMEGDGHTGYRYHESSPRGEARDVREAERFSGDRLGGEITYTTLNQEGETPTWRLGVKDGTVQLDNRWIHMEEHGGYQLMPQKDDSHAYIMNEKLARQPVWVNLLAWEGQKDE